MATGNWFYSGKGIKGDIQKTSGTGAAGTYDVYTIFYTDGSASQYSVYNGKDGASLPPDLSAYSTKAQADLLYKPIGWTPDLSAYSTKSVADGLYLGLTAQASDSAKLGGHLPSYFQVAGNYLTGITSNQVTTALGYTPVSGTPWTSMGYLTAITKAQVEAVLTGLITTHTHNYLSSFTEIDPVFQAWNKSTGISIMKSQVSDFPTQLSQFTNNLGNYGGFVTGTPWTSMGYLTGVTSSQITTAFGSQTANQIYASPNGVAGTPTFRYLQPADIPSGVSAYIWNTSSQQSAIINISGAVTASQFNGSGAGLSSIPLSALLTTPWYSGNHPTTFSGYGIIDTPWTNYLPINNGLVTNDAGLVYNGLQYTSQGNTGTNFSGDLSNITFEGTLASFNAYTNSGQSMGFTLAVPTSSSQGLYYKSMYGGTQRTWTKVWDTKNLIPSNYQLASTAINTGNISNQSVNYANTAGSAGYSTYLPTCYAGGVCDNPQTYFNINVGLKVAMTGFPVVWSDTLWINGYGGSDVLDMCALHFLRDGTPRAFISTQKSNATSYGTIYEIISSYNISSQSVNYASSSGNADTVDSVHMWTGTLAAYNAIGTKSSTTLYIITG